MLPAGAKTYKYIRTGTNHYSLAFTYDWTERERRGGSSVCFTFGETIMGGSIETLRHEGIEWPIRWDRHREF